MDVGPMNGYTEIIRDTPREVPRHRREHPTCRVLGNAIDARARELRLSLPSVAARTGHSPAWLREARNGMVLTPAEVRALQDALDWPTGHVRSLLAGAEAEGRCRCNRPTRGVVVLRAPGTDDTGDTAEAGVRGFAVEVDHPARPSREFRDALDAAASRALNMVGCGFATLFLAVLWLDLAPLLILPRPARKIVLMALSGIAVGMVVCFLVATGQRVPDRTANPEGIE